MSSKNQTFELAISLLQAGNLAAAESNLLKVLKKQPDHVGAHNLLAILLARSGKHLQAEQHFIKAIRAYPMSDATYYNYGITLKALDRLTEALEMFDRSLAINPSSSETWNNRGIILSNRGEFQSAIIDFDKAMSLDPRNAAALANKGRALAGLKLMEQARAAYTTAVALNPKLAETRIGLGNVLRDMRQYDAAIAAYDQAISLKPDLAEAWLGRAHTLMDLKRFEQADLAYDQALRLTPEIDYALGQWMRARMHCCRWDDLEGIYDKVLRGLSNRKKTAMPHVLLSIPSSVTEQKIAAEMYVAETFPGMPEPSHRHELGQGGKVRIGYFSADFYRHATSYLLAELIELHDRSKFEIIGFSLAPRINDHMRERLDAGFDRLIDVDDKSDKEIAELARSLDVDIAVDLKGFTQQARVEIFAHRAAPIQVSYLGYPGTMGAPYIDYLIADNILIPPEHVKGYSEKVVFLPHSYQVNDRKRPVSNRRFTRSELGLPEEGFVFCCFNNSYKITPDVFDIWMRLLATVEDSVIWLFASNEHAVRSLQAAAARAGIESGRLVFAESIDLSEHLARYAAADLFLDTFYYNAHTTGSDALWAGLPMVTRLGDTFAGRVGASLLTAAGVPELITRSSREYEELAFELATNRSRLASLKEQLIKNRLRCPLFDTPLFARHIESAYEKMWDRYRSGLTPDHLVVEQ